MKPKIRILSFHHIPNNGAYLFANSLVGLLRDEFESSDVKIIDYKAPRLALYEFLKRFNVFQKIPFFYNNRSRIWKDTIKKNLDLDIDFPHFIGERKLLQYFSRHCDGLVVGMDVWCIIRGTERPTFPNIYWLPDEIEIPKIAYGVSGYHSDLSLIQQHARELTRYLNDFEVIGSRDRFTHELVLKLRTRSTGLIERIPDLTFMFAIRSTGVKEKLVGMGVDFQQPILGLLLGDRKRSRDIRRHYKAKGYQILALSMYNPYADFNLGHLLDPLEWAESFRLFNFCITDRFHGAVFCLKNQIPFLSLEKDRDLPRSQSKLFDLLSDFDLTDCYQNPKENDFEMRRFLNKADEIEEIWAGSFKADILPKIRTLQNRHRTFIEKMKLELNW